jgi:hypothetical protein
MACQYRGSMSRSLWSAAGISGHVLGARHAAQSACAWGRGMTLSRSAASFQRGPLDDHASFEYQFKLVCASIEYDLWPIENRQSSAGPADLMSR